MRRVVVTGLGAVTPVGNDMRSTWESAVAGRSGIDFIQSFDTSGFPVRIAAEVKDFDPTTVASVKEVRKLERNVLLALAAATEAVGDARPRRRLRAGARRHPLRHRDRRLPRDHGAARRAARARADRIVPTSSRACSSTLHRASSRSRSASAGRTTRPSRPARPGRLPSGRARRSSGEATPTRSSRAAPRRACTR